MSNKTTARRAWAEVHFSGVNITSSIQPYLKNLIYTDSEEDDSDDLQIQLADRDDIWLTKWLNDIVNTAAPASTEWKVGDSVVANGRPQYSSYGNGNPGANVTNHNGKITYLNLKNGIPYPIHVDYLGWFAESQVTKADAASSGDSGSAITGLKIDAVIVAENWKTTGRSKALNCGQFELDMVDASGPPSTITIKSTALPYSTQIRQTKKSRSWEACTLSSIAQAITTENGMACLYESEYNPFYKRVEQAKISDIKLLSKLCHDAGISLKATNNTLVLFDQSAYEKKPPVLTINRDGAAYSKWKLLNGENDKKYASCRVRYTDPATGRVIQAIAYVEDYNAKRENNQQLEITAKVTSAAEAKTLAEKNLRLYNKYQKTASFTLPGNPDLMAGLTVQLVGWGLWSGKYIIKRAVHSLGSGGYTTQIELRRVLGGY